MEEVYITFVQHTTISIEIFPSIDEIIKIQSICPNRYVYSNRLYKETQTNIHRSLWFSPQHGVTRVPGEFLNKWITLFGGTNTTVSLRSMAIWLNLSYICSAYSSVFVYKHLALKINKIHRLFSEKKNITCLRKDWNIFFILFAIELRFIGLVCVPIKKFQPEWRYHKICLVRPSAFLCFNWKPLLETKFYIIKKWI